MVLAYSSLTTACIISLKLDMVNSLKGEGIDFFQNFWGVHLM